jgi:hypothetical protein
MEVQTRYAKSGGLRIAYQVMGAGSDLVMVPGLTSHLEMQWRGPRLPPLRALAVFLLPAGAV